VGTTRRRPETSVFLRHTFEQAPAPAAVVPDLRRQAFPKSLTRRQQRPLPPTRQEVKPLARYAVSELNPRRDAVYNPTSVNQGEGVTKWTLLNSVKTA
jgi:hypothetical protein